MNTYIINSKVRLIKQAKKDLFDVYGIHHTPFTRKIFFYFFILGNKKYVHKESLRFVNSNAETYTTDLNPYYCSLKKEFEPFDPEPFLEKYNGNLLPKLLDNNDKFFVYEYVEGDLVTDLNIKEFYNLKEKILDIKITPFYNSMAFNLVRTVDDIKLIDFKHLEKKKNLPFFVYFYNLKNCINRLYIESKNDLYKVTNLLKTDYPINETEIFIYNKKELK
jgi:hypothetical protein